MADSTIEAFRVDTHVFRELGARLVGRDSTALNELIKNAYDADARKVIVAGFDLDDPERARIVISDDGHGMTVQTMRQGLLTVAGRGKEEGDRRSPRYGRRLTGAKGVGRLAAHKLARHLRIESTPSSDVHGETAVGGDLTIDWDKVESVKHLDEIDRTGAVRLVQRGVAALAAGGTTIYLSELRRRWTPAERSALTHELQGFRAPSVLRVVPRSMLEHGPLLEEIAFGDTSAHDPGFELVPEGELNVGESYEDELLRQQHWLLEIDASAGGVRYQVAPLPRAREELKERARVFTGDLDHPRPEVGPFFKARIFIREGQPRGPGQVANWIRSEGSVRLYLEGFRVLPYGEESDDWLELDRDYARRGNGDLPYLKEFRSSLRTKNKSFAEEPDSLVILPKYQYFGAVFLHEANLGGLQMVVSREGFIPDQAFFDLRRLVRLGVDLSIRHRASCSELRREVRRKQRLASAESRFREEQRREAEQAAAPTTPTPTKNPAPESYDGERPMHDLLERAQTAASTGDLRTVQSVLAVLHETLPDLDEEGTKPDAAAESERILRVLESLGLQFHAFVHELNAALVMVSDAEEAVTSTQKAALAYTAKLEPRFSQARSILGDLRRHLERQTSTLTAVTGPDARRRRQRLSFYDAFEVAQALLATSIQRRKVEVLNRLARDLRSPPMFASELTMLFSNLLTNAVKAAGVGGRIEVDGSPTTTGVEVRIQNTGARVNLSDAERWFVPFESTTMRADPVLGQGMGMGLPISRRIIESYGGRIAFTAPAADFSTCVAFELPLG